MGGQPGTRVSRAKSVMLERQRQEKAEAQHCRVVLASIDGVLTYGRSNGRGIGDIKCKKPIEKVDLKRRSRSPNPECLSIWQKTPYELATGPISTFERALADAPTRPYPLYSILTGGSLRVRARLQHDRLCIHALCIYALSDDDILRQ